MSEYILVPTKLTKVEKIVHLADIHIRLYKRHQEYAEVFETLYDSLRKEDLQNGVIVIAGDIVHSKTDMSPEMITVASGFLKTLADIAPTIIIAGNHDLSISNPNRLDALSPLVENLKHKNLHYFKESGTYQFADVQFGVHSIIGEPSEWPSPEFMKGTKIALYHGPIHNAKTEAGYTVTNKVNLDTFRGYDMVMVGDIHLTQFLQESGGPGVPEVFYVGSLIQQNFGENLSGHGYAIWDVPSSKVEKFVEVKNNYGYFTLTLEGNKAPTVTGMPQNVRLRIICDKSTDSSFVKKIQAAIRKNHNILESSVNYVVRDTVQSEIDEDKWIDNIQDVNQQNSLIRDYIESKFPDTDDDIIEKVLEINTKLNSQIGEDELPKNIHWVPLKLKFDNLFSYGENNEINFENMNGVYGLFAPNAQGKTSAFQSLCFALYDKTPQAFKGSHIMNSRKNTFSCELTFKAGDKKYVIERKGIRKKDGEVKVDVNFYRIEDDGSQYSLNGTDRRDTNAHIRSYVGTYEDFILTALSVQNQNSLFIETGQSDRKDLLSQFIGLTIFDRLLTLGSNEIKEVSAALKAFRQNDFTQKLADTQKSLEQHVKTFNETTVELTTRQEQVEDIVKQITELSVKKVPNVKIIDPLPLEKKRATEEILLANAQTALRNSEVSINQSTTALHQFSPPVSHIEVELKKAVEELRTSKLEVFRLKSEFNIILAQIQEKEITLNRISTHEYDPNCEFCIKNHHDLIAEGHAAKLVIQKLTDGLANLKKEIEAGEKFISGHEDAEKLLEKYNKEQRDRTDALRKHAELELERDRLERQVNFHQHTIKDLASQLDEYSRNKTTIQENKKLDDAIQLLEHDRTKLTKMVKTLQGTIQQEHGKIEVLKTQKQEMMRSLKEADELENTLDAYETYLSVIGRDGLPYELITKVIPSIQNEVNNLLAQMVEFTLSLEVDGKNINAKIVYDENRHWPLELASGMEKFIAGLAIRVALTMVSNLPTTNFLVIDEGFGVLDSDNLSSVFMLFNVLKSNFEFIILISHLDAVRDIADSLIEIKREDGFSYINVA